VKLDPFLLQLAILFLPGLIWARLDARYALKAKPSEVEFLLRAFLFGITAYAVTFLVFRGFGRDFRLFDPGDAAPKLLGDAAAVREILAATAIGLGLALLWIYAATYKWLTRFLQFIRATKSYGDEDVWDFTLNSGRVEVEYVNLRDFENKLVYAGWVDTFSDTDKLRELVLRDVEVFNFEGEKLFQVPRIYLARPSDSIHMEFPYQKQETKP
jgi:hypothetical protein